MICSNGVRLLSSHLIRDTCKSIYEGVFHRTLDSGLWTLSRVIGGGHVAHGHGVDVNNRVLPNSSIRGSASLSIDSNYAAFEDWCKRRGTTFSSEEDKHRMFKVYRYIYIYNGRQYCFGYSPIKSRAPKFGRHGDPKVMYKKPRSRKI